MTLTPLETPLDSRPLRRLLGSALTALAVTACLTAPGAGPKAERGYARAVPIVAALEAYRAAHGAYPDSLPTLVPAYLAPAALDVPSRTQERYPWQYQRDSLGFRLEFRYSGPGMNQCVWTSATRAWRCHGYF